MEDNLTKRKKEIASSSRTYKSHVFLCLLTSCLRRALPDIASPDAWVVGRALGWKVHEVQKGFHFLGALYLFLEIVITASPRPLPA